jgi:hypothetical protein
MKRVLCLLTICFVLVLAGCGGSAAGGLIPDAVPETETAEPTGVKQVIMPRFLSLYYYEPKNDNWESVVAFALYKDGTVGVVCKEEYRAHYAALSQWRNITEIWMSDWGTEVWGLTEDGTVVTISDANVSHLKNVRDLVDGYALKADGSMEYLETGEILPVCNAKEILPVHPDYDWGTWVLCEDGSVYGLNFTDEFGNYVDCERQEMAEIGKIDILDYRLCAYQSDGTIYYAGLEPEALERLQGCVKIGEFYGFYFGITADGELKTASDDAMDYLNQTVESGQFRTTGIRDMLTRDQQMRSSGLFFLYEDGTVCSVSPELNKIIGSWNDIEKIGWYEGYDNWILYALRKDGSVTAVESHAGFFEPDPAVYENYKGWILEDMYVEPFSGCIGVCPEGTLVGDQVFENLDFPQMK